MTPAPSAKTRDIETDFPCYKMDANPRGICLIISNENFTNPDQKREGTEIDTESLKRTFRELYFTVRVKTDLTDSQMKKALQDIAETDHTQYDCFVCCILSHGNFGSVCGSNDETVPIQTLTSYVRADNCRTLAGKPKLFFIQACQGEKKQGGTVIEVDGSSKPKSLKRNVGVKEIIPTEADFLLGFSTVPDYVSFRSPESGSFYIQTLVKVLSRYYDKEDLLSIMVKVNEEVGKEDAIVDGGHYKQMPAPLVSLRKKLFFR